MKKYILGMFVILTLTFFTGQAFCQSGDSDNLPSKEQIEKVRKKVETLKLWKLTDALDLDEATAVKLFPIINKYDKKRFTAEQNIRKDMKNLRKNVDTANPDELKELIGRIEENHKELQAINHEQLEELSSKLPVKKLAKFIIFQQDFDREMKNIIADARHKRRAGLKNKSMMKPGEGPFTEGTETPSP
ncbi:MAG: hypothetical protein AAB089_04105 [Nitrospirota bacterium]